MEANLIPLSPRAWEKGGISFIIFFFFKAKTKYSDDRVIGVERNVPFGVVNDERRRILRGEN